MRTLFRLGSFSIKARLVQIGVVLAALLALALFVAPKPAYAANCISAGTGNWTAITWTNCASGPQSGDTVTIRNGDTVTLNTSTTVAGLTIGQGTSGVFDMNTANNTNRTLTINGSLTINTGGSFTLTDANQANVHTLHIGGDLTNNGSLNLVNGNDVVNVAFNGSANQTVSGTGATMTFNTITINNTGAANNNIVEVSSTNFSVPAAFLTLTNGVFKLSGSFTLSNTFFTPAAYTIPATGGLWLNNANATVTGQNGTATLGGSVRITAGTFNVGTNSGNALLYSTGSSLTIDGGTVNIAGAFRNSAAGATTTFNMSGGTMTVNTVGNAANNVGSFDLLNTGSSFTMSGGMLVIQRENTNATPMDYRNLAATSNVTGGTVQFGNASTPTSHSFIVNSSAPVFNLTLAAGTTLSTQLSTNALTIKGNLTINTGHTFNANNLGIFIAGNWTNTGTWTPGTQTTTFNGTGTQTLSKNGAATSTEAFSTLVIATNAFVDTTNDSVSFTTLTQNGILRRTPDTGNVISGGGPVTFNDSTNNPTTEITQTGGADMGTTTFVVTSNQKPPTCATHYIPDPTVLRWYNITPTNTSGVTANVRLYYHANTTGGANESNSTALAGLRFFHCSDTGWDELASGTYSNGTSENYNWVQLDGVATFSPFALAPSVPTNVDLLYFKAKVTPAKTVKLKWETGSETNLIEFNVLRQRKGASKWITLNTSPIPAKNPGGAIGAKYSFPDKTIKSGKTYRYQLQIKTTSGPELSHIVEVEIP